MHDDFWKSFIFNSKLIDTEGNCIVYFFDCPSWFFEKAINQDEYKDKDIIGRHMLIKTNIKGNEIKEFQISALVMDSPYHFTQRWVDPYNEFCMDAVDLDFFVNGLLDFYNLPI